MNGVNIFVFLFVCARVCVCVNMPEGRYVNALSL